MKFDIRKYFDSIDHKILFALLQKRFKDRELLQILKKIIESYQTKIDKGLPIGNLTSQYFANLYLAGSDYYIKQELGIKSYVRYMDDFVIWHNNKDKILETGKYIADFLNKELNLQLKTYFSNKTVHGLNFLSYRLLPDKILLSSQAKKHFKIKMEHYSNLLENNIWTQEEFAEHARAITSFTEYASSKGFRKKILLRLANVPPALGNV